MADKSRFYEEVIQFFVDHRHLTVDGKPYHLNVESLAHEGGWTGRQMHAKFQIEPDNAEDHHESQYPKEFAERLRSRIIPWDDRPALNQVTGGKESSSLQYSFNSGTKPHTQSDHFHRFVTDYFASPKERTVGAIKAGTDTELEMECLSRPEIIFDSLPLVKHSGRAHRWNR